MQSRNAQYDAMTNKLQQQYAFIENRQLEDYSYSNWRQEAKHFIAENCPEGELENYSYHLRKRIRGQEELKEVLLAILYPVYMLVLPIMLDAEMLGALAAGLTDVQKANVKVVVAVIFAALLVIFGIWDVIYFNKKKCINEELARIVESMN